MKALAKKAAAYAEDHGYLFDHTNTKGFRVYRSALGHEVAVSPGIDEHSYRRLCRDVDRACGIGPDLTQKRNPAQIRQRQERQRELERLDALARARRADLLVADDRQRARLEREIERLDRHIREIKRLMRPESA